jgi:hypothetical protein
MNGKHELMVYPGFVELLVPGLLLGSDESGGL